jgi:23S rRNA pseudouridine1911/1915/1917 synthase
VPGQAEPSWLPPTFNAGHVYRDRVRLQDLQAISGPDSAAAPLISGFYASRYGHSDQAVWCERLAAGEVWRNGRRLRADGPLAPGDQLAWHRPPWQEAAVPVLPEAAVVFDDGDLLVLNKPSGLPVLPAGGFLVHTLLAQLEGWLAAGRLECAAGLPRPVHRLGRFTSGLLVCARRPATRAWLSARLRDSTSAAAEAAPAGACRKTYRALTQPLPGDWALGHSGVITVAIGRRPHPLLGWIWSAAEPGDSAALPCRSTITLLERHPQACLVDVAIATGRPHQIRIHTAAIGAPLLGDPLYLPGGIADPAVLPGAGGYRLHAHRLQLQPPLGEVLQLVAPPPAELTVSA